MDDVELLSTEEFRNRLCDNLKKKGLIDSLKSQVRSRILVELKNVGHDQVFSKVDRLDMSDESLSLRAANSLIASHLRSLGYEYSLSVFLPECGLADDKLLTVKDFLQLLRISSQSKLHENLLNTSKISKTGFFWKLITEIVYANGRTTLDNGTQTDGMRLPSLSLDEEYKKVDAYYSNMDEGQIARGAAIEERLLSYQRLLEERHRSELQLQMTRFKDNELARLRIEERERSRQEVEKIRRESERVYQAKVSALAERERNMSEQLRHQQMTMEKETFIQRQSILEEIEAIKQREAQLRRQEEVDNREKQMLEDRVKSREEIAKKKEESARRAEMEMEQRIRDEVNRFKLEEQSKYQDKLIGVQHREEKVKDDERRLDTELQDIINIKVELREKRKRTDELEAELIRVKHDLLSAQKNLEILGDRAREMADYQILKEDNAVLRRELDNTKIRISELMRDIMVERQKREDLLREMGHQASKPAPEVSILQKQIEQLQNALRTERSLADHHKMQMEQRLAEEIDRNKALLTKYEAQSWRQKEMNWDAVDLRQELLDTRHAFGNNHLYKKSKSSNRLDSVCDSDAILFKTGAERVDPRLYQPGVNPRLLMDSADNTECFSRDQNTPIPSDDYSFTSDLVQDAKNRITSLGRESEQLEKNLNDLLLRGSVLNPVITSSPLNSRKPDPTNNRRIEPLQPGRDRTDISKSSDLRGVSNVQPQTALTASQSYPMQTSSMTGSRAKNTNPNSLQFNHTREEKFSEPKPSRLLEDRLASKPLQERPTYYEPKFASDSQQPVETFLETVQPVFVPSTSVDAGSQRSQSSRSATGTRGDSDPANGASGDRRSDSDKVLQISLDDAWKPSSNGRTAAEELEDERKRREQEEEELSRRRRMEERDRQLEEARLREQKNLEELQKQEDAAKLASRNVDSSEIPDAGTVRDAAASSAEKEANDVSSEESDIDPEMKKYMKIVQEQKKNEKEKEKVVPVSKSEDISTQSENSDIEEDIQSAENEDDW